MGMYHCWRETPLINKQGFIDPGSTLLNVNYVAFCGLFEGIVRYPFDLRHEPGYHWASENIPTKEVPFLEF